MKGKSMRRIFLLLALVKLLRADPAPPVSVTECYLQPDMSRPSARHTPGMDGGPGSGRWSGQLKLRNETSENQFVEAAVVHVLDGYGKPLFDIDPKHKGLIPCRKEITWPIQAEYFGGVSSFKFSCDITVKAANGQIQVYPQLPVAEAKKPTRLPGY